MRVVYALRCKSKHYYIFAVTKKLLKKLFNEKEVLII